MGNLVYNDEPDTEVFYGPSKEISVEYIRLDRGILDHSPMVWGEEYLDWPKLWSPHFLNQDSHLTCIIGKAKPFSLTLSTLQAPDLLMLWWTVDLVFKATSGLLN